ncbi:MAG TPA: hypothetical protein VFB99_18800, partial [Vicinamibacterales bacterium]|nr:hypothetical protein [Vicinamibacterales bacterium]
MRLRALQWTAPLLLAVHLPLFVFSTNIHAVVGREIYAAAGVALLVAGLSLVCAYLMTRDRSRAVCLAAGVVAWSFWYRLFSYALTASIGVEIIALGAAAVAVVTWTTLWALYGAAVVRARSMERLASVWLLASVALVAQPLATLGSYAAQRPTPQAVDTPGVPLQAPAVPPDIVHLVFDRYASADVLREYYGFDNTPFTEKLRERGFLVAQRSNANYFRTGLSLAATLNLTHLDERFASLAGASDWRPVYRLLREHRVWRSLKPLGYEYVQLGSWWEATRHNPHAAENRSYVRIPYFVHWLYDNTPLSAMGVSLGGVLDIRQEQWHRIHRQVHDLERVRAGTRPRFVLAHFLLPHDPYVFGPEGDLLPADVTRARPLSENYVNQVRFANRAILRLVDAMLADSTRGRPIIIVQSDEGPYPRRYEANTGGFDWRTATRDELREKFGILNAMYFPGGIPAAFHDAITPVNTYRLIFNAYFGARLPMLADRSLVSVGDRT